MSLRRRPIFPQQIDLSIEVLMCSSLMMDVWDGDRFRLRGDQIKHMHDDYWVMGPPNYGLIRLKYNVTDVTTAMLAMQPMAEMPQLALMGVMLNEFEPTNYADCCLYVYNNRPTIIIIRLRAEPKHSFSLRHVMYFELPIRRLRPGKYGEPVWDGAVARDGHQLFAAV